MNKVESNIQEETIEKFYFKAVKGLSENESILYDYDKWNLYCKNLPVKEFVVYSILLFDYQVKNGGFHQYFFNSYGIFCYQVIENLKLINCSKHAEILEKAINVIKSDSIDNDTFLREIFNRKNEYINSFDELIFKTLEPLEDEYYEIEENEVIFNELYRYLIK